MRQGKGSSSRGEAKRSDVWYRVQVTAVERNDGRELDRTGLGGIEIGRAARRQSWWWWRIGGCLDVEVEAWRWRWRWRGSRRNVDVATWRVGDKAGKEGNNK